MSLVLAAGLVATACATAPKARPQADQDADGRLLGRAIQAAESAGVGFSLDETITETGGQVPSGQTLGLHPSGSGTLVQDSVRMSFKFLQAKNKTNYDVVVADGGFFIKPHGGSDWLVTPEPSLTSFYPAVRLPLVRESVLLAKSVAAPSLQHISAGFTHKYVVTPAPEQLEQLDAMPVQGAQETAFLKSAAAEFDVFLSVPGDHLMRVEVHIAGTDPVTGTRQKIDSGADFKAARVKPIEAPSGATAVNPNQIFSH